MELIHVDEIRRRRPLDDEARERVEELKDQLRRAVDEANGDSAGQ
jgi:hypothetical protein